MPRRANCFCLMLAISLVGCASVPEVKYAADPKTGEVFGYHDSRTWLERHPAANAPVVMAEMAGTGLLYGTLFAGVFALYFAGATHSGGASLPTLPIN